MDFLPENIQKYISDNSQSESLILKELNRYTNSKVILPRMLSGHVQGRFLSMISKLVNPEIIVEVGTYTGYSCLCLAEGLKKNGKIITIEKNEEFASIAKKFFDRSKYKEKISLLVEDATSAIENINEKIDLAFIDADKLNYTKYYDLLFPKLKAGGLILADNVLWSGKVTEDVSDNETQSIKNFNTKVKNDQRAENLIVGIRDGIMVCQKIKD
ncbi:O-methyltransferase [Bacteroidota bacterium]|nr:O-methyltransferase [Bacteroidota bacterium]